MTNIPTDAEILAFAVETGMRVRTGKGVVTFARAVLDKWGQPAPQQEAQEPAAVVVPCHTPSGKRVALYSAKQDLPIGTQLYTAPQPVAREPLPSVEIMRIVMGVEQQHNFLRGTTNWATAVGRAVERAHGIGGQHG